MKNGSIFYGIPTSSIVMPSRPKAAGAYAYVYAGAH